MTRNAMAREKALYDGHPVAAVAATSESIAKAALKLIKVEYEPLPHVIDPVEAMKPDAPILHDYMRTKGVKDSNKPTNVVERYELGIGDVEAGFKRGRRHRRARVRHQADAPGLHRAARLRRLDLRGRPDRAVVLHAGAVGLSATGCPTS